MGMCGWKWREPGGPHVDGAGAGGYEARFARYKDRASPFRGSRAWSTLRFGFPSVVFGVAKRRLVGSTDRCCVSACPLQARASCKSSLTHWHWRAWWLKIYVEWHLGRPLVMTVRRSRGLHGYLSVWSREHHGIRPRGGGWSEVGGRLGRGW